MRKTRYTLEEDKKIWNYVISKVKQGATDCDTISWEDLRENTGVKRNAPSLKSRFEKTLLPCLFETEFLNLKTKLKLWKALRVSLEPGVLKKIRRKAEVETDAEGCIVRYANKDCFSSSGTAKGYGRPMLIQITKHEVKSLKRRIATMRKHARPMDPEHWATENHDEVDVGVPQKKQIQTDNAKENNNEAPIVENSFRQETEISQMTDWQTSANTHSTTKKEIEAIRIVQELKKAVQCLETPLITPMICKIDEIIQQLGEKTSRERFIKSSGKEQCKKRVKTMSIGQSDDSIIIGLSDDEEESTSSSIKVSSSSLKRRKVIDQDSPVDEVYEVEGIESKKKKPTENNRSNTEASLKNEIRKSSLEVQLETGSTDFPPVIEVGNTPRKENSDIEEIEEIVVVERSKKDPKPKEIIYLSNEMNFVQPSRLVVKNEPVRDEEESWTGPPEDYEPTMGDFTRDWSMQQFFSSLKDVIVSSNTDLLKRIQEAQIISPPSQSSTVVCESNSTTSIRPKKKKRVKKIAKINKKEIPVKKFIEELRESVTRLNCAELNSVGSQMGEMILMNEQKTVTVGKMKLAIDAAIAILSG